MKKGNFIIDVNKKMTDNKTSQVKYCLDRCDSPNFYYMDLEEVLLLIHSLQAAIQDEMKERGEHE